MDAIIINMKEPRNAVETMFIEEKRNKVAETLQTARVQKGLTQQQVADAIGCQVQTINKIENAKYSPNAEILYQLANVLSIKITLNNIEI